MIDGPTISRFYGILIRMYFSDHPPPHFHVRFGEYKARVEIATGDILDGRLPARAERMIGERCAQRLAPEPVEPLA